MENAADALKMAAAVLVFVMALGIGISSFSQARYTAQVLIGYADRETVTQYAEDARTNTRIVGKETIVPAIYRAYKENYKIFFYDASGAPIELYTRIRDGETEHVNSIDLERDNLGSDRQEENFIMALLYGEKGTFKKADGSAMTWTEFTTELAMNNSKITLKSEGIYDTILRDNTFEEKFGVYYQDEIITIDSDTDISDEFEDTETPEANKVTKRVISYQAIS